MTLFKAKQKGIITIWVLAFGTVFLIMLAGIISYAGFQIKQNSRLIASNQAFHIAEAGLNYARWHLAHDENDFSFSGVYDYNDLAGGLVGRYELQVISPTPCDTGVGVRSTGWTVKMPEEQRALEIKYAKPVLARYGFLTNSNVWFGPLEALKGPFHSNGGIRMDGAQNSLSTSARTTYICTSEHGCSSGNCSAPCSWTGSGCECPGIWGAGAGEGLGLWQFPSSNIDFDAITQDMADLKTEAQINTTYFGDSGSFGYHVVFNPAGTFSVYQVTGLKSPVSGYNGAQWTNESNSINTEALLGTYDFPDNCAPVFFEDDLWVDGTVNGRITLVAARLPDMPGTNANIVIPDNIVYSDSNDVLGLIAQKDVLIPLYSPNNLTIEAAMLAQKGHVFRYYYPNWSYYPYNTYAIRNLIETRGSIITNTIWTFTWVSGGGGVVSGYANTDMSYTPDLTYSPPPHFPVSGDYDIIDWQEIN